MKILFLDDDQDRHDAMKRHLVGVPDVVMVYTVEEAIMALRSHPRFDVAFLDHDLAGQQMVMEREGTGTIVAEFIAAMEPERRPIDVVVHSFNPIGAQRMMQILEAAEAKAVQCAFGSKEFQVSAQWCVCRARERERERAVSP